MPKGVAAVFCSLLTTVFASAASAEGQDETALDRYVAAPDPSYRYELISPESGDAYTANVLEMTSQRWRTAAEVDRPLWKHWLTIVRPERATTNTGLLAKQGWKAYFIEITFPSAGPYRYQFTTGVRVTPDRLPFESPAEVEGTAARSGTASDR
jgi:PhoPQ-activated pathogenicity-related protein